MPGAPDMKVPVRRRRSDVGSITVAGSEAEPPPGPLADAPPAKEQAPAETTRAAGQPGSSPVTGAAAPPSAEQQTDQDSPPEDSVVPALRDTPLPAEVPGSLVRNPRIPPAPETEKRVPAGATKEAEQQDTSPAPAATGATATESGSPTAQESPPETAGHVPAVSAATEPLLDGQVTAPLLPALRPNLARRTPAGALLDELTILGESARRSPEEWASYSPNLRGDVNERFKEWVQDYAIGTGNFDIHKNHCLHAALSRMPLDNRGMIDIALVAQSGREWLAAHPGRSAPANRGGQSSVGAQLEFLLRILGRRLPSAKPKIELWAVLSAYVTQFMDDNPPPVPQL